ncbi:MULTISPECIES: hypothetical protein [unclassified Streptomyces]|uniref:hypothetical protein n=1 Tax=Streptomyces TaxID=1883 RepID=UPI0001C1D506|nr:MULTISPECIES: hypothetical protein [unclassified Streptomyces]AEN12435.1 hypothetical protein SACTE_4608 [Streptomyces sp. SirexAA-E]MYR69826.1 hypothetical protein [Streptomyces sp. SID4939]MYS00180.1 hypothetical protein [Streptomyces sp. SID4940]MYT63024.1 hypothetical protein [Streptomyces sp. SID8357]MYT88700.1 hypothetical protein [Streptomyces sp. SID8360]
MEKAHDGFDEDFGLSGLTQKFQDPAPVEDVAAATEVVAAVADQFEGAYAWQLLEDAQRLVSSSLSDEVIVTLWLGATRGYFDPTAHAMDGRSWLRGIAEVCVVRIRRDEPSFVPAAPARPGHPELRPAVLDEIRAVGPALAEAGMTSLHADPLPGLVPALERAVAEVGADLGFRLFLRALQAYFVRISGTTHQRLLALGERLGHNRFVVDDGCLNVWPELD